VLTGERRLRRHEVGRDAFEQEVAAALGVSDATVERDWTITRAWLIREMGPQ
jgi:ECF sigma factor